MNIDVATEEGLKKIDLNTIDLDGFRELLLKISVKSIVPDDANTFLYSGTMNGRSTLDIVLKALKVYAV